VRPAEAPGYPLNDWLNLFVLHQNRLQHSGAAAKNCIKEEYLPRFLDMVIWGHEHECILEPWVRCPGLCPADSPWAALLPALRSCGRLCMMFKAAPRCGVLPP
jgi:DNA repair exonuclease SbcCD nuclease subunit